ncbi:MAG: 3-hydroxyisobutyrate dehydrogenase [Candidatus Limnocylindrales bacterium]
MAKRIGFVGLGVMGRPMALNLVKAGHALTVFDLDPAAIAALVNAGAHAAPSAREAARGQEVVVTMLPASRHVEAAYRGPDGVLSGLGPGMVVIDMSTIDPGTSRRIAGEVGATGAAMLDAPVSGSSTGAAEGTLTIMVGGDAAHLEAQRDLLEAMGRTIIHCGVTGMGEAVKLCNQLVAGASVAAVAEAFALGARLGADPTVLFDVMSRSSGNCWALQTRPPVAGLVPTAPSEHDFAPGFMVDLMHKDLALIMAAASEVGLPLALAATAQQLYARASEQGYGRSDFSAVFKVLEHDEVTT